MGVQVTEENFAVPKRSVTKSSADQADHSIKRPKTYETKTSATGDIIDYLKIGTTSKIELMSVNSLHNKNAIRDKKYIFSAETWTRCRKVTNTDFQVDEQLTFTNLEPRR